MANKGWTAPKKTFSFLLFFFPFLLPFHPLSPYSFGIHCCCCCIIFPTQNLRSLQQGHCRHWQRRYWFVRRSFVRFILARPEKIPQLWLQTQRYLLASMVYAKLNKTKTKQEGHCRNKKGIFLQRFKIEWWTLHRTLVLIFILKIVNVKKVFCFRSRLKVEVRRYV